MSNFVAWIIITIIIVSFSHQWLLEDFIEARETSLISFPELKYSSQSQLCCALDSFNSSTDFPVPQFYLSSREFDRSPRPSRENKRKQKIGQRLGPGKRAEKAMEYEGDSETNCRWSLWNCPPKVGKRDWGNWKSEEEPRLSRSEHS